MVEENRFGGPWTEEKLKCLGEYLPAYMQIFTKNERARFFTTIYVDAFAGTGARTEARRTSNSLDLFDSDAEEYKRGSVRIALESEPPFASYVFVERNTARAKQLESLKQEYPNRAERIVVVPEEANSFLLRWCRETDWRKNRAVVFLDPYGMQVNWETLEAIAATRAIDLWLLFPVGQAVNRILTKQGPPPEEWERALTRIFGTDDWKSEFYKPTGQPSLFGDEDGVAKDASVVTIGSFFLRRLQTIFHAVAPNPRVLRNKQGTPLFLFCFAAANEKGARPALNIARYILGKTDG